VSVIRQIAESIAETLSAHPFFRTVPKIPVLIEDGKDIETSIMAAMKSAGAFALVHFESGDSESADTPGPYLSNSSFASRYRRSRRSGGRRRATRHRPRRLLRQSLRILHHTQPLDKNDEPLSGGVMIFSGLESQTNESMLQKVVSLTIPVGLSTNEPTR
jgi:hypothetical protein